MKLHELIESIGFKQFLKRLEMFSLLLIIFGLILKFSFNQIHSSSLIVVGFSSIAISYFFMGFKVLNSTSPFAMVFFRIYGWGLSISAVSILFNIQHYPISEYSLIICLVMVLVALILSVRMNKNQENDDFDLWHYLRLIMAILVLPLIYFIYVHPIF